MTTHATGSAAAVAGSGATAAGQAAELSALLQIQLSTANIPLAPATGTQTSVANANADTLLLAAAPGRLGATIFNDDTASTGATLNVLLGTTAASASVYTVRIAPQGYYEVPFKYTGQIRGFASAATGNARITALTA